MDSKGRVSVPAPFRTEGDGKYYVKFGPDGALLVYDEEGHERMRARLEELDEFEAQARSVRRIFYSGMAQQECDDHGRIKLSSEMIKHAGLKTEVVLNGMASYFEIWDKSKWDDEYAKSLMRFDRDMQDLRRRGKGQE